jgi:hypothetical protein
LDYLREEAVVLFLKEGMVVQSQMVETAQQSRMEEMEALSQLVL